MTTHPTGRGVLLGVPLADPCAANPILRLVQTLTGLANPKGMLQGAGSGRTFDLRGPTRLTP